MRNVANDFVRVPKETDGKNGDFPLTPLSSLPSFETTVNRDSHQIYMPSNPGGVTYSNWPGQVFKYDPKKVASFRALGMCCTRGNAFGSRRLWKDVFIIVLLAVVLIPVTYFSYIHSGCEKNREDDRIMPSVSAFLNALHGLLSFFCGLYLSLCVSRWWEVRNTGIGGLWGAVDDLCLLLGVYLPGEGANKESRELILRWAVLSHELIYKQAQGVTDMTDLINMGLLTSEERDRFEGLCSLPQMVWSWVASYICHLCFGDASEGGSRIPFPDTVFTQLIALCVKARGSIGTVFAYTDTQLPFRYVHFISFLIWMHNIVQALVSSVVFGKSLHLALHCGDSHSVSTFGIMVVEVLYLIVYPCCFFALLLLSERLSNPLLSAHGTDLPRRAYSRDMFLESRAMFTATSNPPYLSNPNSKLPNWSQSSFKSYYKAS